LPAGGSEPGRVARTGVILLGGESSRMGSMKALLDFAGEPLVERVARRIAPVVDEIVLVAGPAAGLSAAVRTAIAAIVARLATNARPSIVCHDQRAYQGPVAGLATGLAVAGGELCAALACDLPFVEPRLVAHLLTAAAEGSHDVVVPVQRGLPEPLCAVYRVATMRAIFRAQLADGDLKPTARYGAVRTRLVDEAEWRALDPEGLSFVNLNDREEYRRALERASGATRRDAEGS